MSSCTECHGMGGKKYDDHKSSDCPRLIAKRSVMSHEVNEKVNASFSINRDFLISSSEEFVKGLTMTAFQRGNWQKPMDMSDLKPFITALEQLLRSHSEAYAAEKVEAARLDQIEQDFLTYNIELPNDESEIMAVRDLCLTQLINDKTPGKEI